LVAGLGGMAGDELRWWCGGDGGGPISYGFLIDFLYKIHHMHSMILYYFCACCVFYFF